MTKAEKRASRRITVLLVCVLTGILVLVGGILASNRDAGMQSDRADTANASADAAELDRATACAQVQALGLRCAVPLAPEQATDPAVDSPPLDGRDGAMGPIGPIGITGPPGPSAYDLARMLGYQGTKAQWLASLKGATGKTGATGAQGKTGAPGTPAEPAPDPVPGADGANGQDGKDGTDGADGKDGTDGAQGSTCVDRDGDGLYACGAAPTPTEPASEDVPVVVVPTSTP